jgi:rsbT co-antagonist protein RsbR
MTHDDELARLRAQLAESEEKYRLLVEHIQEGLYMVADAKLIYCNEALAAMAGYTPDEILGKDFLMLIAPEDHERAMDYYRQRLSGDKTPSEVEYNGLHKDGETRIPIMISAARVTYEGQDVIMGTVMNLSAQREIETERERTQRAIIDSQQRALAELSTPIIPVVDRIIVVPLIGSVDDARSRYIMRAMLQGIGRHRAKIVILDVTGVPYIDGGVADRLSRAIQAARLKGAQTIVTGVSDAVAETIVALDIDWHDVETLADLQTGLHTALQRLGKQLG